ncbi:MAG: glycosyltransferase family 9 protein [Deltaproteobacteria bacterium]|nr:glycosyltransferase family 9 protein [Deltaproteobacteria bacterium]
MLVKGNSDLIKDIRNVLLIQLGDIGDVVWATPTFRAVKEAYPQANVSVLLRESFGSLLKADPNIHKIFEVKRYRGNFFEKAIKQLSFIRALRQEHFDLVFDLRSDDRGAVMGFLSGSPIRASIVYHYIPWRNKLFTHLADPPPVDKTVCTAAEQSLRVVREFGVDSQDDLPKLWVSEKIHNRAKQLFDKEGIDDNRIITLNPFSRWRYKEYGYDKWVEIIDWLWEEYEIATIIIGAIEEKEQSEYMVQRCCGRVFNLTGKTTLGELAGVLNHSCLHLGVDSAAPHIAAAVGTPTITIYGPSDWRDWAPQGDIHRVIIPDRDCAPCQQKGCDGSGISKCLQELKVDKLKKIIRESLNNCLHKTDIK